MALIINLYSGLSAEDVLDENVDFLKQIGLQEYLSMTRSNGLNMMLEKIRNYGKKIPKKRIMICKSWEKRLCLFCVKYMILKSL